MRDRFGLIFVVLAACGTLCILVALAVVGWLFNCHAAAMAVANPHEFPVYSFTFGLFVLLPALATMGVGICLLVTGVRIGQKEASGSSENMKQ